MKFTLIVLIVLMLANYYMAYCMGWIKRAKDTNNRFRTLLDEAQTTEMNVNTFIDKMFDVHTSNEKEPYFFRAVSKLYDKFKKQQSN